MRNLAEKNMKVHLTEKETQPKKSILVKPLPLRPQANMLSGTCSSFRPWQRPSKPLHNLATIAENKSYPSEENLTGGGVAISAATNDHNTSKTAEQEKARKIKRTISNRQAARRSRLKRITYTTNLEKEAHSYEEKIDSLLREIEAYEIKNRILQIEHRRLKMFMAAHEKQRILQEVSLEKSIAEVDMLKEQKKKMIAEVLNGGMNVKREVDNVQQAQNQSQIRTTNCDIGHRSIPYLDLMKSEPES